MTDFNVRNICAPISCVLDHDHSFSRTSLSGVINPSTSLSLFAHSLARIRRKIPIKWTTRVRAARRGAVTHILKNVKVPYRQPSYRTY